MFVSGRSSPVIYELQKWWPNKSWKSLQNIGFLKASKKEDKREEASHYYRPGKLFEIVFSLSRIEISMVRLRGNILTSNIVQVPQKQLASLKTWASIWKLECSLQKLSVCHVLQKPRWKLDSFGTERFLLLTDLQVGDQSEFSIKPPRSSFFLSPPQSLFILASNLHNANFSLASRGYEEERTTAREPARGLYWYIAHLKCYYGQNFGCPFLFSFGK